MVSSKRRTRLLSFRLYEDEYEDLKNLSTAQGARSISECARSVLSVWIGSQSQSPEEALESEVYRLSREVDRLTRLVKRTYPNRTQQNNNDEPAASS